MRIETPAGGRGAGEAGQAAAARHHHGKPSALLPGIPPLAEAADLPGYDIGGWNGLMVPAGTPQPILDRLLAEIEAGLATPEMRGALRRHRDRAGAGRPGATSAAMLRTEAALFGPVIRQLGIRAE